MSNTGGPKQLYTHMRTGKISPNTFPHAHTLEAIKYSSASSPVFDRDRQSQDSVLHTQVWRWRQQDAATPALGYLITLLKKLQCNRLQK